MAAEHGMQNAVRNALAESGFFFRANVGQAWTGAKITKLPGGRVLIEGARPFNTGLPPGFSDVFGFVPVTITQDMVGKTVAVFTAIECKSPTGRKQDNQRRFIGAVQGAGGRAGFARDVATALAIAGGHDETFGVR